MAEFYRMAGNVLKDLQRREGSLKSVVFLSQNVNLRTKKKLYALLYKTLKCKVNKPLFIMHLLLTLICLDKDLISKVITSTNLMEKESQVRPLM